MPVTLCIADSWEGCVSTVVRSIASLSLSRSRAGERASTRGREERPKKKKKRRAFCTHIKKKGGASCVGNKREKLSTCSPTK